MMVMMMMMLLLLFMVSLLCLTAEATPPPPEYLVKQNCQPKCGEVVIPFPFGIGESCYLDPWFSVDCRNAPGRAGKPFLNNTKFNLELLHVSLDQKTVTVNSPVASYHQQKARLQSSMNLEDTPFLFSMFHNNFMVVGCGYAKLIDHAGRSLAGCASICSNGDADQIGCDGIGCCQTWISTRISYNLSAYNLSFTPEGDEGNTSSSTHIYAFLEDNTKWHYPLINARFPNISAEPEDVRGVKDAPLTLFWIIKQGKLKGSSGCDGSITTPIHLTSSGSYSSSSCNCPFPYEGNPYLHNGCNHVIKECANCSKTCSFQYLSNNESAGSELQYFCSRKDWNDKLRAEMLGFSIGGGSLLILFGSFVLYKVVKKQKEITRKQLFFKRNGGLLLEQQISSDKVAIEKTKIFTSEELKKATDNFNLNRILGQGGQGTVYKGMLTDGRIVAVKKSIIVDESQIEHFINEIVILSQIRHRNIVRLLGCCLEIEVPLLVYEFIPNGTLFQYIHNQDTDFPLSWEKRLQIAIEVARALSYLHSACSIPIYHRDIKSTNILLDDKYRAKVSDFGTSRSISIDQTHLTTLVQGTIGYLDPEYFQSSQFTEKSDVYSFGVVLVELLTGEKPICSIRPQEVKSLATHFILALEGSHLFDILDARIIKEGRKEETMAVAYLAYRCLNLSGRNRPTMKEVYMELENIIASPPPLKVEQSFEENACNISMEIIGPLDDHSPYCTNCNTMGPPNGTSFFPTSSCLKCPLSSSLDEQPLSFNTI